MLGAGGMGEVYRARDTRLQRDVALKVLPAVWAADPDRVGRFAREAQMLAALNHPNIAAIYGFEEWSAGKALVLELVEGPTLADRIAHGPIPLDEALDMARQIADALEAAHEVGIIHRDLKPSNIKLSSTGAVKVLDFGLAKLHDTAGVHRSGAAAQSMSPTLTSPAMTAVGVILGTAAYMSPEQAKGRTVDTRADIWAFGVILYEMLTGEQLFAAETVTETLAAVLTRPLPLDQVPPQVRPAIARTLERVPKQRLRDIGDFQALLDASAASGIVPPRIVRVNRLAAATVALAIVGAAAAIAISLLTRSDVDRPVQRFGYWKPALNLGVDVPPAISPDGRRFLYVADGTLWVHYRDEVDPRPLLRPADTLPGATAPLRIQHPFWAPDGNAIGFFAFFAAAKLWILPLTGGRPTPIAAALLSAATTPGAVWTTDGRILFAPARIAEPALLAVSAQGGEFSSALELDRKVENDLHRPSLLPDGRSLLFVIDHADGGADAIGVLSGAMKKIVLRARGEQLDSPVYSPSGHIVYQLGGTSPAVWAVPFSLDRLEVTGEPFLVASDARWPTVSRDGTLLYGSNSGGLVQLMLLDRDGQVVRSVGAPRTVQTTPRFSPDGTRIATTETEGVVVYDLARDTTVRAASEKNAARNLAWPVAGDRVFYEAGRRIYSVPAAGGEPPTLVVDDGLNPTVSADGRWLVFGRSVPGEGQKIFYKDLAADGEPRAFANATGVQAVAAGAPSGRHAAYASTESGRREIYVASFPDGRAKWLVATGEGGGLKWNRAGTRLYYRDGERILEVSVMVTGTQVTLDGPRVRVGQLESANWDISPDESAFAVVRPVADPDAKPPLLILVENWHKGAGALQPQ